MKRKWPLIWLALSLLTSASARQFPAFALFLKLYAARPLSAIISALSALLPFPAAGLYLAVLALLPGAALLALRHKPFKRPLAVLLCALLTGYILLWDVLYACSAPPASNISTASLAALCEQFVDRAEEALPSAFPIEKHVLPDAALQLMRAQTGFPLQSVKWTPFPTLFSSLGVAGLYFPLTGEAFINGDELPDTLPFTICHELAHQAGWARESEANYAAFLACEACDVPAFRYSAHFAMLLYGMSMLHKADEARWRDCLNRMSSLLLKRFARAGGLDFTPSVGAQAMQEKLTDAFLRLSGDASGIGSYEQVIPLIAAHWQTQE
ncbi:MAG: DUF3810 family protein [Clostridia bacterium]|nr:DUF3810 family protein [Clostridia bacterium]